MLRSLGFGTPEGGEFHLLKVGFGSGRPLQGRQGDGTLEEPTVHARGRGPEAAEPGTAASSTGCNQLQKTVVLVSVNLMAPGRRYLDPGGEPMKGTHRLHDVTGRPPPLRPRWLSAWVANGHGAASVGSIMAVPRP